MAEVTVGASTGSTWRTGRKQALVIQSAVLIAALSGVFVPIIWVALVALAAIVPAYILGPGKSGPVLVGALVVLPDAPVLTTLQGFQVSPESVILLGLTLLAFLWWADGRLIFKPFPALRWWVLWFIAVIVGSVERRPDHTLPLFFLEVVVPFAVGVGLGRTEELRRRLTAALAWSTVVVAVVGVIELATNRLLLPGPAVSLQDAYYRLGHVRARANFGDPLALGMYLCLGLFFIIVYFRGWKAYVAVSVAIAAIFGTLSRSALIGLAAGGVTYLLVTTRRRRRRTLLAMAIIVAAFAALPVSLGTHFRSYLFESLTPGTVAAGNVTGRQRLLHATLEAANTHPFFGYGFGSVTGGTASFVGYGGQVFTDIADLPAAILLETGYVGLVAFVGIVATTLRALLRQGRNRERAAAAGVIAALVGSLGVTALQVVGILLLTLGAFSVPTQVATVQCCDDVLRVPDGARTTVGPTETCRPSK